jgi:hypothetical protein
MAGCSGAASSVKGGATWSAPIRVESNSLSSDDSSIYGVSCPTQQTLGTGALDDRLMDVSCATRRFCVAVNLRGLTLTFDGQRWSTVPGTGPRGMISLSCCSTSFCLAVADSGAYATFDGRRWSVPSAIPGFGAVFAYSVWCSSTTRCTAIGLSGMAANWQQGRWSEPVRVFPGGYSALGGGVMCLTRHLHCPQQ